MKTKTQHSKIWDTGKAVLCADLLRKQEKFQINKLPYHLKEYEKEE